MKSSPKAVSETPGARDSRKRLVKRHVRWLLLQRPERLNEEDEQALEQVLAADETLAKGHELTQQFRDIVSRREVAKVGDWVTEAKASRLGPFATLAKGLEADGEAVRASLQYDWSNGRTEGQVTRVKLIKRQGYDRAKLDLLKQRVVLTA